MRLEIVERPYGFDTFYADQVVGSIRRDRDQVWQYRVWVRSWDYFDQKAVRRLKAMVDDKIKILNLTERIIK